MRYLTLANREIDTDRQLAEAERHVVMKLMLWASLGLEQDDFARRRAEALRKGWNNQGALSESAALKELGDDLARRLAIKRGAPGPGWLRAQVFTENFRGGGLRPIDGQGAAPRWEVIDAADVVRGVLEAPAGDSEAALAEFTRGQGELAEKVRALGLELRLA